MPRGDFMGRYASHKEAHVSDNHPEWTAEAELEEAVLRPIMPSQPWHFGTLARASWHEAAARRRYKRGRGAPPTDHQVEI